ncbi:MAG: hypothetical protein M0Z53_05395 [Thermaerobacter sp.]|nr:hypothetical protein [Thermaerobacter sp.]
MAEPALTKISALGMRWLGRLPATCSLCDQLKDHAWTREDAWIEIGVLAAKRRVTAATASDQLVRAAKIQWHDITPTMTEQVVPRRPRGRQKAGGDQTQITQYTVQWHWTAPTADRIQQARERQSTFILTTSDQTGDGATALRAYCKIETNTASVL